MPGNSGMNLGLQLWLERFPRQAAFLFKHQGETVRRFHKRFTDSVNVPP